MPVYNEEASIAAVVDEWLPALRALGAEARLLAIDDGSRDRTPAILRDLARVYPELDVRTQANRGHGRACIEGYRGALRDGAEWVLQIDSDGQCDPAFLPAVWAARETSAVVLGLRVRRDDGWVRWLVSRVVSLAVLLGARVWLPDPNVPYRLMGRDALARALDGFPAECDLANIALAARLKRSCGVRSVPIRFRQRRGGSSTLRPAALFRRGWALFGQLRRDRQRA
jgi:glycosyltransferase involved in cell wall biosynthesis